MLLAFEEEAIVGLMLIYDGSIVQLRGEPEAVRLLLGNLELDAVELQAPIHCEKEVLKKFPKL